MAHRRQVVNLIRLCFLDDAGHVHRISQITVMQKKVLILGMRILVEVIDAVGIEK